MTISANLVTAALDHGLIFGRLGLPACEVTGAGGAWGGGLVPVGLMTLVRRFRSGAWQRIRIRAGARPSRAGPSSPGAG